MESQSIGFQERVHVTAAAVDARLFDLGLTREPLLVSVHFGYTYWAECTPHDPLTLPGQMASGKAVRMLRDLQIPNGWIALNDENVPLVVHPSERWAITVWAGDRNTGFPDKTPSTRNEKGPGTQRAVRINQFSFASISDNFAQQETAGLRQRWILLHHRDKGTEEIRVELALPAEMNERGLVTRWLERIILVEANSGLAIPDAVPDADDESDDGGIDIPVLKRA